MDEDGAGRSVPAARRSKPRRCCRRCSIYRTLLAETAGGSLVVSDASLRAGVVLDVAEPKNRRHRRGLRAPGAGERRGARPSLPVRSRPRPARRDARHPAVRRASRRARARRPRAAAAAGVRRCCTTSASTSACARITSIRSTSSPRRRSSGCRTRRRRSSRTSPATIAAACRRTATCRSSRSTAPIG